MKPLQKICAIAFVINEVCLLSLLVWMFCFLDSNALLPRWAMISVWVLGGCSIPLGAVTLMSKGGKR